jgi:hypothetical protein
VVAECAATRAPQRGSCVLVWPKGLDVERNTWTFEYVLAENVAIPPIASLPENRGIIEAGTIEQSSPDKDILFTIRQRATDEIVRRSPSHQFGRIFFLGGFFPRVGPPAPDAEPYLVDIFPSQQQGRWNWAVVSLGKGNSVFDRLPGDRAVHQITVPAAEYVAAFIRQH